MVEAVLPPVGDEHERRRELRRMKLQATGLLALAAVIFVLARLREGEWSWLGYVRATAEAAMVGALADWFAVTALFRHPLGLPIPHTAIIKTRKDALGRSLGLFVQDNFLSDVVIGEKIRAAHVSRRLAGWLNQPGSAAAISRHAAAALAGGIEVLDDEDVQGALEQAVLNRVRQLQLAPLAGRALELATNEGRHQELLDAGTRGIIRFLDEHRESLRDRFGQESPWWVPETIDRRIFDKLYDGLRGFLEEVANTPDHEFRRYLDERLAELVVRLQTDPELAARGEKLKEELLDHPAVRAWTGSLWSELKKGLLEQTADPESELRTRLEGAAAAFGRVLVEDSALQEKIDRWVESAALYVVKQERHQVAELIAATVARWDPDEAAQRIELQVGRDLQFIRINGTIVGGLAGLAIYSLGRLIG
jgi:uncharacterized membrane-anchored protein YjiN (DUF445 family)